MTVAKALSMILGGNVGNVRNVLALAGVIVLATTQITLAQEAASPLPAAPPVRTELTKNYFVPLADIITFDFLVNRYGERFIDRDTYKVSFPSIKRNLKSH